jgi:SAM-dependent methyltransferase
VTAILRRRDGAVIELAVPRWHAEADEVERRLLADLPDPVLDVGCGPGRVVAALAADGRPALGIDPAPSAVTVAVRRGGAALVRSVFDPLPGVGRWGGVVLLDGNVGIGGDPETLLSRTRELLVPGGVVLAELAPPPVATERFQVQLDLADGSHPGPWFDWATVAAHDFAPLCGRAGLTPVAPVRVGRRWFATAEKR